jgi:spore maturation protein CgeB
MATILYLGELSPGQTARMRMRALQRLGHQVVGIDTVQPWRQASWLNRQWQRRLSRGAIVRSINRSVRVAAKQFCPDLVWADKQEFLWASTVEALRQRGALTVHFTPDPYFTLAWKQTPLQTQALRSYEVLAYCKAYERQHYEATGAALLALPLGFCEEQHRPVPPSDPSWCAAVGFLGGWEPRRQLLLGAVAAVVPAGDGGVNLWGGHWDFLRTGRAGLRSRLILRQLAGMEPYSIRADPLIAGCLRGDEVYGDAYAQALTGARIGLGFLRKVWPDQHTTRSFEIPACGSMLLADRSREHQQLFREGVEAEFFSCSEELVDKARFYCRQESARARIAAAGRRRCFTSGYSYLHRMNTALKTLGVTSPADGLKDSLTD